LGYKRYYSPFKYVLAIIAALSLFAVVVNSYMLSQQPVENGVESYWVVHDAGISVLDDSILWRQGEHVDAGMTKSQVDFKLVIPELSRDHYITVAPAYLDTVIIEFFDQYGDTLNREIMGDKEPHQLAAYHYYVGRFLMEIPTDAASARIKIRSTQNMAVSLNFLSRDMLVRQSAFSVIVISLVLFIIMGAVIASFIAGFKSKQPLFFAFAAHQVACFSALLALSNLLPSFWPHLNQLNGEVLGALLITLVMTGAIFHWLVLKGMIATRWLKPVVGAVVLITFANLIIYFFGDQNIGIISSNITTALLAVGLIYFIPRNKPKNKIQGFIFKKIRVFYSLLMLLVAIGSLSELGFGQYPLINFYLYTLVSLLVLAIILLLRTTISHRRTLNVATASLGLAGSNDQLNKDLAEQSALLSMLSHEIKTPLTTLHFCSSGTLKEGTINKQLAYIQHLVDKVELMGNLSTHFISHEKVYLKDLIRHQWRKQKTSSADGAQFNLMSRGDISFVGNKLALALIVNDLLSNARKYATDGGVQVKVIVQGEHIYLRFKNNSENLTPLSLSVLTDKYYRAPNVAGIRGTGLGLWIVKNLCVANDYSLGFQLKGNVFIATVGMKL
jgi:signal transduction histidine kinase